MQKAVHNGHIELPHLLTSGELELLALGLAAGPLLFARHFSPAISLAALAVLASTFLIRYLRTGELLRYTHANPAVLSLLLIFGPISLFTSSLPLAIVGLVTQR
ncbi:MAG: hypothetical protein R3C44_21125 [Chloroflexota bacterium]